MRLPAAGSASVRVAKTKLPSTSAIVGATVKSFVAAASSARLSACVRPVAVGASLTGATLIEALAMPPPRPASALLVEACTSKLPVPLKFGSGVNFSPALACASVMNVPALTGVVPSAR
ncbi:hypothetical protein AOPFMNJM_1514 [Methylobacterium jeotgali]|uniref:Uncharacterized protein n=1 Tax=Methylobacterium jeotgali TaxID=381630 RepID=A0ABQ4SW99_9HYPH|nr:hypothetical protein AOPFMNJM_1514 [Methylobacterium jeotgali]